METEPRRRAARLLYSLHCRHTHTHVHTGPTQHNIKCIYRPPAAWCPRASPPPRITCTIIPNPEIPTTTDTMTCARGVAHMYLRPRCCPDSDLHCDTAVVHPMRWHTYLKRLLNIAERFTVLFDKQVHIRLSSTYWHLLAGRRARGAPCLPQYGLTVR